MEKNNIRIPLFKFKFVFYFILFFISLMFLDQVTDPFIGTMILILSLFLPSMLIGILLKFVVRENAFRRSIWFFILNEIFGILALLFNLMIHIEHFFLAFSPLIIYILLIVIVYYAYKSVLANENLNPDGTSGN